MLMFAHLESRCDRIVSAKTLFSHTEYYKDKCLYHRAMFEYYTLLFTKKGKLCKFNPDVHESVRNLHYNERNAFGYKVLDELEFDSISKETGDLPANLTNMDETNGDSSVHENNSQLNDSNNDSAMVIEEAQQANIDENRNETPNNEAIPFTTDDVDMIDNVTNEIDPDLVNEDRIQRMNSFQQDILFFIEND